MRQEVIVASSTVIRRISTSLEVLAIFLAVLGLVFRSTLYWSIPVSGNEAYGLADVLELLIAVILLGICLIGVLMSLALSSKPRLQPRIQSIQLLVICLVSFGSYWFIHPLMPRLLGP